MPVFAVQERLQPVAAAYGATGTHISVFPTSLLVTMGRGESATLGTRRAGLPWVRPHDLRHAYATFLLADGVGPRTVIELMGHSTLRLTMELYGPALPERMHEAAKTLDELLDRE